jgi:exo-1,4-beta-D-glucosaminidase
MPPTRVIVTGTYHEVSGETRAHLKISNDSGHIAFFLRAEIARETGGAEVLPIRYDDNYITLFPHESRTIDAVVDTSFIPGHKLVARVEAYNMAAVEVPLVEGKQ